MRIQLRQFCFLSILIVLQTLSFAQQPGTNVNVLPSYPNSAGSTQTFYPFPPGPPAITLTDALRGDGYLQRQVEPVVAPSSYNPDHLLAAFGDYRTVSLPGSGSATVTSEGWIGLSRSYDRGHTWFGSLVPGFPQDTSAVGKASPLFGLQAGSDAILATTPGGHFYLGGLFFTRGGISNVAVVHYRDIPNTDGGDAIQYQGAVIVDKGSQSDTGNFEDKPSIAADITRGTTDPSVCGPVYMAYTIFVGGTSGVFTSKIGFVSSAQGSCGSAFTHQQYLNKNFKQNQGTAMAVDPTTGKIYVVWRHIFIPGGDGFPDAIVMVSSTNGGVSFSSPVIISSSTFAPFDQISVATTTDSQHPTFRSTAYPTITVDGNSNVYVAIQERTSPSSPSNYPAGYYSPRIILRTLRSGQTKWTTGSVVDSGLPANPPAMSDAQQVMPTLSFAAGQLRLMWYDFRDQNQISNSVGGGWFISGLDRQTQTYVAQSSLSDTDANGNPVFNPSVPVTQYLSDASKVPPQPPTVGNAGKDPAVNRPNLPMYVGGTMPFTGDYIWLMSANPFVANPGGKSAFRWATKPTDYIALDSYGVWADSRDAVFPTLNSGGTPNLYDLTGWTEYAPPGTGLSCVNGGARNENVYFSEIKPGIVAGSPATSRQLVDGTGKPIERAFPIYVQNPNSTEYSYKFTFASGPGPTVNGSFVQGTEVTSPTTTITLPIVPFSSATMTVYAYCPACTTSTAIAPFSVVINQLDSSQKTLATTTVFFNGDPTAPFVTNTQVEPLSNGEVHNASVSNPQWANPQWANPQWANPQWANPQWANPQWANVAPAAASTPVGDLVWTVTNAGNNASAYTSILNVATSGVAATTGNNYLYQIIVSRQYNFPGFSSCGSQPIPQDQIISIIPTVDFSNPQWANPQWANPQWANPQWANATFAAVPPPAGATSAPSALSSTIAAATTADDGTIKMPVQADHVFVVLRIYRNGGSTTPLSAAEQAAFQANVSQVIVAQAANTGSTVPTSTSNKGFTSTTLVSSANPSVYGQAVTFTAQVTRTSGSGTPTGSVDFKDGTTLLQTVPVSGGGASLLTSPSLLNSLAPGAHTITAFYSGDPNFNGGMSNSVTQTVTAAATTTTLLSNLNPSIAGQTVNFTATVAPVSPSAATPSGIVNFIDCINVCVPVGSGTLTTSGQVTVPVSLPTPGSNSITAVYQGTSNFAGSTSNAVSQFVQALTTTSISVSPTPSALNQVVTLTATVTPIGASGPPTGMVQFVIDAGKVVLSAPLNSSGTASVPYTFTTLGSLSVIANYIGDANFAGSSSPTFSQPVQSPHFADFSALASCGYSMIPAQPILSYASIDTSTAAQTDSVRVSFVSGTSESGASGMSSIFVPASNLLVVNSPGTANGVTGWNVYVNNILQNSGSPIPIGTSWTEPATGFVTQGQLPSAPSINPSNAPGCLKTNSGVGDGGVSVGPSTYANTILNSGADALELTQEVSSQDSSAWFNVLQPVKNGFTTTFTFQISDPQSLAASGYLADGIAFVIHNSSSGLTAIGGSGGSIGYGPSNSGSGNGTPVASSGTVDNSVVVEFDTYDNTPFNGDPNGNHVAVQSCGPGQQNSNAHDSPGPNNQGGFPNCSLAINSPLVNFSDGTVHTVTINYLPPGAATSGSCVSAGTGELDVTLDITSVISACMTIENQFSLAGASSDSAYVGFTSATGFYDEEADILNWNFTPTGPAIIQ